MISYRPLWITLAEKNMSKTDFRDLCNINKQTLTVMNQNRNISMATIDRICSKLDCPISAVIEHVKEL